MVAFFSKRVGLFLVNPGDKMTKKTGVMVLIDLVRALGYKNPEKLAN